MDDLQSKLDVMERAKLVGELQENSVRIMKLNIKFTKSNQKHSLERLDAIFGSFERMFRNIPKKFLSVEREVRLKYVSPLGPERKLFLWRLLNREMETLGDQMIRDLRDLYQGFGKGQEFERRVAELVAATKANVQDLIDKLEATVNAEGTGTARISPRELRHLYQLDDSALVDLKVIQPLQNIHHILGTLPSPDGSGNSALEGIKKALLQFVRIARETESGAWSVTSVKGRKEKKMEVAEIYLALKELVFGLNTLAEYIPVEPGARNREVIRKTWSGIEVLLGQKYKAEAILGELKLFHELIEAE